MFNRLSSYKRVIITQEDKKTQIFATAELYVHHEQ